MYFDNSHIDDVFKRQLEDYSVPPGKELWCRIDQHLSLKRRERRNNVFKIAASVTLIAALTTILLLQKAFHTPSDDLSSVILLQEQNPVLTASQNWVVSSATETEKGTYIAQPGELDDLTIPSNMEKELLVESGKQADKISNGPAISKLRTKQKPIELTQNETGISDFYAAYHTSSGVRNRKSLLFNESSRIKEEKFFTVGANFSPTLSYRKTSAAKSPGASANESSLLAYSGGLDIGYKVTDKLKIRTGIHYTQIGQSLSNVSVTKDSYAYTDGQTVIKIASSVGEGQLNYQNISPKHKSRTPDFISQANNTPPQFTMNNTLYQKFEMVKIPFTFEYAILNKSLNISMIGGINANILYNQGIYMQQSQNNTRIGTTEGLNKVNYSTTVGLGLKYQLGENAELYMEPRMDYFVTSFSKDHSYQTFPYFVGLYSGLSISF